ncbi:MAG: SGNH/GDSL hydrolase family protein [Deltaproteobacteria bacterium]|nr:SGNH/GDSL hydrolase family protein [Deltaproteobacteria bacterium]
MPSLARTGRATGLVLAGVMSSGCTERSATEPDAFVPDARLASGSSDSGASDGADAAEVDGGVMRQSYRSYLALGSSSTFGSGASEPERAYVRLVATHLRELEPELTTLNLGSGGARISRFLEARAKIESFGPEVTTILPFTDFASTPADELLSGYATLLDALGAAGSTVFFGDLRIDSALVCGAGAGPGGCYPADQQALIAPKNEVIAELASSRPFVHVVPIFDQNAAHPEWNAPDGHPNDLGHEYLAQQFINAIDSAR